MRRRHQGWGKKNNKGRVELSSKTEPVALTFCTISERLSSVSQCVKDQPCQFASPPLAACETSTVVPMGEQRLPVVMVGTCTNRKPISQPERETGLDRSRRQLKSSAAQILRVDRGANARGGAKVQSRESSSGRQKKPEEANWCVCVSTCGRVFRHAVIVPRRISSAEANIA